MVQIRFFKIQVKNDAKNQQPEVPKTNLLIFNTLPRQLDVKIDVKTQKRPFRVFPCEVHTSVSPKRLSHGFRRIYADCDASACEQARVSRPQPAMHFSMLSCG